MSTPCILGEKGVIRVLELPLDGVEAKQLVQSAQVLRKPSKNHRWASGMHSVGGNNE